MPDTFIKNNMSVVLSLYEIIKKYKYEKAHYKSIG